jgi:hypothetical protein
VIPSLGGEPQTWYTVSNARRQERLRTRVRVHGERRRIEEVLQEGKGEIGLVPCEVSGGGGWHQHVILALWFLTPECPRLGAKNAGLDAAPGMADLQPVAAPPAARPTPGRRAAQRLLRRNEESSIHAWHQTKTFPPRRLIPKRSAGAPGKSRLQ